MNNSKRHVDKEVWNKIFLLFFEIIGKRDSREEFESIISGILSPSERIMVGKRITTMYLLLKGIDTNTICSTIKVTRPTVAKCSILLDTNSKLKKDLKDIIRKDKISDIFKEFISELYGPGTPGIDWSSAWRRKKAIERKKQRGI